MSKSMLRNLIAVFAIVTAIIHLILGVGDLSSSLGILFLLNGLGYLVLLAALWFGIPAGRGKLVQWALIAFTAVTVIAYFVVSSEPMNPFGLFDKVVELALIAVTYLHLQAD